MILDYPGRSNAAANTLTERRKGAFDTEKRRLYGGKADSEKGDAEMLALKMKRPQPRTQADSRSRKGKARDSLLEPPEGTSSSSPLTLAP